MGIIEDHVLQWLSEGYTIVEIHVAIDKALTKFREGHYYIPWAGWDIAEKQ